jgi:hypothetical protein
LNSAGDTAYDGSMATAVRVLLLGAALAALPAVGCDGTGGLLVVTGQLDGGGGSPTAIVGPSVTDFVSAGTVAKSAKYKAVYTLGQATPNQGVSTSTQHTDNGGLVGAMNGVPASADVP